jgi:poly-gamma-glutamate capsule biosynthesis protein CapA/YwtB (metallophosphatase superfamily)
VLKSPSSSKSFIRLSSLVLIFFIIALAIIKVRFSQSNSQPSSLTEIAELNFLPLTPASPSLVEPTYKILFGGDVMLDRSIRIKMEKHGPDFVLAELTSTFHEYDMVVANLEGTITTYPTRSVNTAVDDPNHFMFTFDPNVTPMLKRNNFQIVSLANNHSEDFGLDGVTQTKQYLSDSEINYFGNTGFEQQPSNRVFIKNELSPSLAFVGYNQFVTDGLATALADIQYATTAADLVIVMPHWGPEYKPTANSDIVSEAHQLIEAGADLIIGSHPHIIQQKETYLGKTIYYSLGNFVFDQYFDERFQKGLLVGVDIFADKTMRFTELKIKTEGTGQTKLLK